ncbi:MAG: hypothetical protein D6820_07695 [Lentisphaerae bacterium]|nr:MAG: hypothetical protein D6820_07695 [Lentisphaerota bacterium]
MSYRKGVLVNQLIQSSLWLLAGGVVLMFVGCQSTVYPPKEVEKTLALSMVQAQKHLQAGNQAEASYLLNGVRQIDSEYPGIDKVLSQIDPRYRYRKSARGINLAWRVPVKRHFFTRLLLYIPDRIFDALDIVTADVNIGPGVYAEGHVTRMLQVGGGGKATLGIGLHTQRSLGLENLDAGGIHLLLFGMEGAWMAKVGTSGVFSGGAGNVGIQGPKDEIYQKVYDYWGIGGSVNAGLVGAKVEFHPLQLFDFILGFIGVDFLHDDFAHSRGLRFSERDITLLKKMSRYAASRETLRRYHLAMKTTEKQQKREAGKNKYQFQIKDEVGP